MGEQEWGWHAWAHNAYEVIASVEHPTDFVIRKGSPVSNLLLTNENYSVRYFDRKQDAYNFIRQRRDNLSEEKFSPASPWPMLRSTERALPAGHVWARHAVDFFGAVVNPTESLEIEWYEHLDHITQHSPRFDWDVGGMPTDAYLARHIGSRDGRWWVVQYLN